MRRHAKAATAGSTKRQATGLGRPRVSSIALALAASAILFACAAAPAAATQFQRPFIGTFGSAEQPSFGSPTTLAVDPGTGDLLVGDSSDNTIKRFNPDGTPAPFAALGSNAIDGREGAKPCAEEPASCDKTPQNGIAIRNQREGTQITVDRSGGPTDGNIYLTQNQQDLVDIFSSEGRYLGQLTEVNLPDFGFTNLGFPCGVAVDPSGAVYVSGSGRFLGGEPTISKYVPTGNPPVNADNTANFATPNGHNNCGIAAGAGPTVNWIFAPLGNTNQDGVFDERIDKINKETGELQYSFAEGQALLGAATVDPTSGRLIVVGRSRSGGAQREGEALEFDASGSSGAAQTARLLARDRKQIQGIAADSSGNVYVAGFGNSTIDVYGPPAIVPTVTADPASNVTGTKATLTGSVNPEGLEVSECFFKYGPTSNYGSEAPCEGSIPTDSNPHPVHLNVSGLQPNGQTYHFRLFAKNANGTEESKDQSFVTAQTVATEAASDLSPTTATLRGTVRPEGDPFTACFFEYGLQTSASFEKTAPCNPASAGIEADFSPHPVSAAIGGLQPGSTYRFRLIATDAGGTIKGEELTFTTFGAPRITEVRALDADQGSVKLEGKINPSGFGTNYRFEWGPTDSYGNQAPAEFEPYIGDGTTPVRVSAKLTGLSAGSAYHYRIVASSAGGTTASPDQLAETLNSCGLPEDRCFELVSRRDAGPVAIPGEAFAAAEMHYQAATQGPGKLAYVVEAGYPDSTKGAEVLYRGTRGAGGWDSTQLSTPINAPNEQGLGESTTGPVQWLSHDLSCGIAESFYPLTDDPATRLAREYGGSNLYRINPDDSYTAVSNLAPENAQELVEKGFELGFYFVAGASQDCGKVIFESSYRYPGIAGAGQGRLYEWDEGTLRNVGVVPGPSGEVVVGATAGTGASIVEDSQNTVSEDGSRVFFSATRQTSPNPAEIGKRGIFVREDGTTTRDLSLSETSTPVGDATYRWASPDGSKVFFTANAGLTDESSSEGTDLYMYDLESEELTDLTPYEGEGGAQVAGFIGAAENGSRVYFASPNQLVPGRGKTLARNQSEETYSIYGVSNGEFDFVGTFSKKQFDRVVLDEQGDWASQVSPDGRYLLFESSVNVTDYDSGGAGEAYLYDAEGGSEGTVCVSCRQDGLPSVAPAGPAPEVPTYQVLPSTANIFNRAQTLTVRDGEPQVFFSSPDKLAPGAVEHQNNIYEWSHGQVFRLVSAEAGQQSPYPGSGKFALLAGASKDGSDVYMVTPETLNWEDGDARLSVYDARIGGGFPEPPPPPDPCDPDSEGSCQSPSSQGSSAPGAASKDLRGSGNVKEPTTRVNRCNRSARQAQSLSRRAKRLARNARKANRRNHKKAVRLERKAHRLAKRAQGKSKQARRCRKRQRANDNRRAGK